MKTLFLLLLLLSAATLHFSCSNPSGKVTNGLKVIYFPKTKQIQQEMELKEGKVCGYLKEYYKNGKLKAKYTMDKDVVIDTCYFYYENGKLRSYQVKDKKGLRTGCWRSYNKSGVLVEEYNYLNDQLHGANRKFTYLTGRPLLDFNYYKGHKHGKQQKYYNNGKPEYVAYYNFGSPCIGAREFAESGKEITDDYKILISEENKIHMEGVYRIRVKLSNPQSGDKVCLVEPEKAKDSCITEQIYMFPDGKNGFTYEIRGSSGFIMRQLMFVAYRKTDKGNVIIKRKGLNIALNY